MMLDYNGLFVIRVNSDGQKHVFRMVKNNGEQQSWIIIQYFFQFRYLWCDPLLFVEEIQTPMNNYCSIMMVLRGRLQEWFSAWWWPGGWFHAPSNGAWYLLGGSSPHFLRMNRWGYLLYLDPTFAQKWDAYATVQNSSRWPISTWELILSEKPVPVPTPQESTSEHKRNDGQRLCNQLGQGSAASVEWRSLCAACCH